jgi:hypothetical protein
MSEMDSMFDGIYEHAFAAERCRCAWRMLEYGWKLEKED